MAIDDIIKTVSIMSGVSVADIVGKSRKEDILKSRQYVCWEAYRKGHTLSAIGKKMNMGHPNVHHSVKAFYNRIETSNTKIKL